MRKIAWSSVVALTLVGACGAEPDTSDVTSEEALRAGPTRRIAALVGQSNIVANLDTAGAKMVDAELKNAWGLAFNPAGPAWVSANGSGLSPVYDPDGNRLLRVVVPPPSTGTPPSTPTGQVFNDDHSTFRGDFFIFAAEDGTISGWQPTDGTNAVLQDETFVKNGAVFKGLAIAESHGHRRLYVADFHNNRVVVYNDDYRPIRMRPWSFVDRALPKGFAPFNIVEHNGFLFVAYAKQDDDAHDDAKGPGNGFIDVYEPDGDLVQRLISRGTLDSPWGMAFMAAGKKGCGKRDRLLVGNFGDGRINVFELQHFGRYLNADLIGALGDKATGKPLVIEGLWALVFGPGAGGFDADDLYFTAGPNDEADGIFGEISFD